jgi:hypothetical protein
MKHVRVIIRPDGSCSVDAVNFTDATCLSVTKQIAAALGGGIVAEQSKPEARIRERCRQQERERAR